MNQVEVTFRKTRVEKVQEKRRNENHRTGGKCDLRWVGYVASDGCIKVLLVSATFRQTCPAFLTETRTARNPRRTARYPRRTARYPRRTARNPRRHREHRPRSFSPARLRPPRETPRMLGLRPLPAADTPGTAPASPGSPPGSS